MSDAPTVPLQPRPAAVDTLETGSSLGRYLVTGRIGAGGAGTVYAAFDTVLDRKVALKMLQTPDRDAATATVAPGWRRLVREARMLARLTDAHVVTVYDVGEIEGRPYLAMEFVEGADLSRWIARHRGPDAEEPGTLREAIALVMAAGRGLAAAHAAGVIHGDFKPANVLVDLAGRAKVTDFGIARMRAATDDDAVQAADGARAPSSDGDDTVETDAARSSDARTTTRGGPIVGTPAYMAPEQLDGGPADEGSDVYAFCTTLFQAVHGRLPFGGQTLAEMAARKVSQPVERPKGAATPRWLDGILERGLHPDPAQRTADIESVLDALRSGMGRVRRRWVALGGLVVVAAAATVAFTRASTHPLCASAESAVDAWESERRPALAAAFERTEHAARSETWSIVSQRLDDYVQRWQRHHEATCEAAGREGVDALVERSFSCLRRRRIAMQTLFEVFADIDAEGVPGAAPAVAALPELDACVDAERLATDVALPPNPMDRAAAESLRDVLARGQTLSGAGAYDEAMAVANRAVADADALGFAPLAAEAALLLGHVLEDAGQYTDARERLGEAFFTAQQAEHHAVAGEAAERLVFLVGVRLEEYDAGLLWVEHARVALSKSGGSTARLLTNEAAILDRKGQYAEAIAKYEEALQRLEAASAESHEIAVTHMRLADSLRAFGRADEALTHYREATAQFERALGRTHPNFAVSQLSTGTALASLGRTDEAIETFEGAIEALQVAVGPQHPTVAVALTNLGIALKNAGRLEEAEAAQRRALDLTQTIYGPRHRKVALRHEALGRLLTRADRATEAVSHHLVAVEIHDAELGTEHPDTILSRLNLAEAQYAAGQTREGLDTYANAHQHAQKLAEDHPMRADAAIYYASKLVDAQRSAEAAPLLEPALAVLEPLESYDDVVALGRFTLARILWARDRSRALRLAHAAHGHLHPPEQAVLQQWLSTHDTAR